MDGNRTELACAAILFDMDGTLVDSTECVIRQWRLWAERHGLDPRPILEVSHGRPTLETLQLIAPHFATAEELQALEIGESEDREGVKEVRGAASFVSRLPGDRWAVVTSASRRVARIRLELVGLPIPAVLVTADDVRRGKPHPEPYLLAARLLGRPAQSCLVIEDAPLGIDAARAAGMQVLGITTTLSCEVLGAPLCIPDFEGLQLRVEASMEPALRISLPR
jgi:sugar-phosphatase